MTLSQSIRSLDFFENLNDEQIDVLSNFSFISKYEKDSILFYETDLKTNLLFLVSGLISVVNGRLLPYCSFISSSCKNSFVCISYL